MDNSFKPSHDSSHHVPAPSGGEIYDPGDYNKGGMVAFAFSMVVTLLFFIYVAFIHSGVNLGEIPSSQKEKKQGSQPSIEQEGSSSE